MKITLLAAIPLFLNDPHALTVLKLLCSLLAIVICINYVIHRQLDQIPFSFYECAFKNQGLLELDLTIDLCNHVTCDNLVFQRNLVASITHCRI